MMGVFLASLKVEELILNGYLVNIKSENKCKKGLVTVIFLLIVELNP